LIPQEVDLSALVTCFIPGIDGPIYGAISGRVAQALSSTPGFRALADGAHS
jgi:hypothetical protein